MQPFVCLPEFVLGPDSARYHVHALLRHTPAASDGAAIGAGSPLFRAVTPRGRISPDRLCDRSVARAVKRACEAAGLDPQHYSGHSLRSGLVTSAAERGLAEWRIRLTLHISPRLWGLRLSNANPSEQDSARLRSPFLGESVYNDRRSERLLR